MERLVEQSKKLIASIKATESKINNPALVIGVISQLEFFIENLGDEN